MLTAIIVAAGDSRRMGFDKLFATIAGRPVIAHTMRAFESAKAIASPLRRNFAAPDSARRHRSDHRWMRILLLP
jgi:CTP:molybdopterin cytidylyltransferase MocA